jgi:uncharacterized protein YndB with AHSA1/START domain/uncharacterized membrane protein YphA (DoxX/SURF4 family)
MSSTTAIAPVSKKMLWAGWILTVLPALLFAASGVMKLVQPGMSEQFARLGYASSQALGLGILELVCALLFIVPRTSVLGAILLTGYLGGATATHVRIGDPFFGPVIFGIVLWLGLYLRDERLRALVPFRSDPARPASRLPLFQKILFVLVAIVVVLAIGVALQPSTFRVTRSATIAAPPSQVFDQVNDLHNWQAWSPWAKLDPAAKNTFDGPSAGVGASFAWSGNNQVGEGRMTITESRPNELIRIKLDFVRPFTGTNTAEFTFKPHAAAQTDVTWSIFGDRDVPSKIFCLFVNMDQMLGGEFEKGLAELKTIAEAKK